MGKRLINVDEVEEIVPVLVGKLLENNLITGEPLQANVSRTYRRYYFEYKRPL